MEENPSWKKYIILKKDNGVDLDMTDRYFKREYEHEYYIFDSEVITESEFEEKQEYEGYRAFEDCMMGDTVVDRLNHYSKQLIEAGKLIENGVEIAREKRQLELKLATIEREFRERSILTEKEFLELIE